MESTHARASKLDGAEGDELAILSESDSLNDIVGNAVENADDAF